MSNPDYTGTDTPLYTFDGNPTNIAGANIALFSLQDQNRAIIEALASGYALALEVGDAGATVGTHAITLWGVEYTESPNGELTFTKAYITDSDDKYEGIVTATVNSKGHLVDMEGEMKNGAYSITDAHGMRTAIVPEPSSAALSLLALASLAARRRRPEHNFKR